MNRAYSILTCKAMNEDDNYHYIEGIASTPSPDRMGDVVEPMGAKFKLPMPLLWQHDSLQPVGTVEFATPSSKGIPFKAKLPKIKENGKLKDRVDEAIQSIKYKLVAAVSIGFNAIEGKYERMKEGGYRFKEWEWLELSLVTIPANSEATLKQVKSLDKDMLTAIGRGHELSQSQSRVSDKSNLKGNIMTLSELKELRSQKAARMAELAEVEQMDENQITEFDDLEIEVKELDTQIRQKRLEVINGATATKVEGANTKSATSTRSHNIIVKSSDADEAFEGQNFTRLVIAKTLAQLNGGFSSGIAQARWGKSNPTLVQILKANEVAGGSSDTWGAELVTADNRYTGDFIEFLYSMTVYDKLGLREVPAHVTIKGQDGAATGYWVGESKPIPASAADFSTVSLTPLKVAALAVVSNEMLRDSSPAAEALVRDALVQAAAQRIDATFLSGSAAVSGVSPAGILNGVTPSASAGVDAAGLRTDIKNLYRPFINAKNASGLTLVMHPSTAKALSLLVNALGQTEFPQLTATGGTLLGDRVVTGENVDPSQIILVKPSDIYRIGARGIEVSMSRDASIEQNSIPTGATDTPVGASTAWTNMFQAESTAMKVVMPINFAKRRASAVAYVEGADYDGVNS